MNRRNSRIEQGRTVSLLALGAAMASTLVLVAPQPAQADSLRGPTRTEESVNANSTDIYHITFRGGESAEIFVSGDGDTDLDLYVYDAAGNPVARDDDRTDDCLVRFFVRRTGTYTVRVRNRGSVYNDYVMLTN